MRNKEDGSVLSSESHGKSRDVETLLVKSKFK